MTTGGRRPPPIPRRHSPIYGCAGAVERPSLAVGSQVGYLEAGMASVARNQAKRNRWLIGAGWMAGISIVLVEMQMGMDYVQASVAEQARMIAGWLPVIGTLLCRFMGSFVPPTAGVASFARLLLFSAIPVGLAAMGWLVKSRATE